MPNAPLRQRATMAVIKAARRAFANTAVHQLPMVDWVHRRTVLAAWGGQDITVDFRGLRLTVPGGEHVLASGLTGGYYESIELDLLERLAAGSQTVVDVGANIGVHTCVGAAKLPADGWLVAFEPVPTTREVLRHNIKENGLGTRVEVAEYAVGETAGETEIHLASSSTNHSLAAGVVANSRAAIPVKVTSLDEYFAGDASPDSISVLKIDVEGYDGYALRGAAGLLRRYQPTLMVEFIPASLAKAGFRPADFLDLVFAAFPHVYVIDEPRRKLTECTTQDLRRYGEKSLNLNLVAVANPEHRAIIEDYRTALR